MLVDRETIGYAGRPRQRHPRPRRLRRAPSSPAYIEYGASPRGSLGLVRAARVLAMFRGRRHVTNDDLRDLAPDVLRHRIVLSYDALSEGMTADRILDRILATVSVPLDDHIRAAAA